MTVTSADIGWSSFSSFEGPFFGGRQRYVLPETPSENDRIMAVVTAAEGGHYDAINMYDAGIVSVGLIQWINAGQHSVDAMLGRVIADCGIDKVLGPLKPALDASKATFKQTPAGLWRFHDAGGIAVETNTQQRGLFFLGCGPKGTWNASAKLHAKVWAAAFANIWEDAGARKAQVDYTVPKLKSFLFGDVQKSLYDGNPDTGWYGAIRAAVISFGVNLPSPTAKLYNAFASTTKSKKWSTDWCIGLLKHVTFQSGQHHWLLRYNSIRPVMEKLWGVSLPKTTKELAAWVPTGADVPVTPPPPPPPPQPSKVPIVTLPVIPGETPGERIVRIYKMYDGVSLRVRKDELGKLVARGVDKPESVVGITTNCATTALGIMALAGVKHVLLNKPYVNGMAIAWVRQVGLETGALVKFDGKTMPKPGSLLRYNTAGTNNDHVEWLLGPVDANGHAEHGGGGRADNAVTSGTGDIRTSWGRPLVEWWDPDKLGIDVKDVKPVDPTPVPVPTPEPEPIPVPVPPPTPPPTPPAPIVVGKEPAWRTLVNFVVMLFNAFFKRGKK